MSYQLTGFSFPQLGWLTLRKPNEGEFKAVLPGSQLPLPFKADDEQQDIFLSLYDSSVIQATDALELEQEQTLAIANADNTQSADTVSIISESELSVNDSYNTQYAESISLEQEHNLGVSDSNVVNVSDSLDLLQEHSLGVSDSVNLQVADGFALISEGNLKVEDSIIEQRTDSIVISIEGENVVTAENSAHTITSPVITLSSTLGIGRIRATRYTLYPESAQEKIDKDEFYLSYYLRVASGSVGNVSDTVNLTEHQQIKAESVVFGVLDNAGNVITLTQKRRKRFMQEEEIILLAA